MPNIDLSLNALGTKKVILTSLAYKRIKTRITRSVVIMKKDHEKKKMDFVVTGDHVCSSNNTSPIFRVAIKTLEKTRATVALETFIFTRRKQLIIISF